MIRNPLDGLEILTDGEDRDEWHQVRRGVITATAAAAIIGSHPYYGIVDVWNEQTDPDWNPADARTRWTAQYIDNGTEREAAIIEWASEDERTGGPGNPFVPVSAVVRAPGVTIGACSPDGAKRARDGGLVLVEAKTEQKDWEANGIPQHVWDQCQWQLLTTGAVTVWLAVETYRWSGRGPNKVATLVKTWLYPVRPDANRQAALVTAVEQFQQDMADGIAPESEVHLEDLTVPDLQPDDEPEDAERKVAEAEQAQALLDMQSERAAIVAYLEHVKPDQDRLAEIDKALKAAAREFHGRRVQLVGPQFTAKLTRYTRTILDTSDMPDEWHRAHARWPETERVTIDPTPTPENESETPA